MAITNRHIYRLLTGLKAIFFLFSAIGGFMGILWTVSNHPKIGIPVFVLLLSYGIGFVCDPFHWDNERNRE